MCTLTDFQVQVWNVAIQRNNFCFLPEIVTWVDDSQILTSGKSSFIANGFLSSPHAESVNKCKWEHVNSLCTPRKIPYSLLAETRSTSWESVSYNSNILLQLSKLNIRDKMFRLSNLCSSMLKCMLLLILFSNFISLAKHLTTIYLHPPFSWGCVEKPKLNVKALAHQIVCSIRNIMDKYSMLSEVIQTWQPLPFFEGQNTDTCMWSG